MCTNRQTAVFGHLPVPVQVQHRLGVQAAKIDAGAVGVHHIDVKVILGARPHVLTRIESVPGPLLILSEQSKPPIELLGIEIKAEQTVEACGRQEYVAILAYYLVAVFQIAIAIRFFDRKFLVIAKQLVAGGDVDIVAVEGDAAQASIRPPAFEINIARIPVDVLLTRLLFEVDRVYAAVALTLLAATNDRCRDKFWKFECDDWRTLLSIIIPLVC